MPLLVDLSTLRCEALYGHVDVIYIYILGKNGQFLWFLENFLSQRSNSIRPHGTNHLKIFRGLSYSNIQLPWPFNGGYVTTFPIIGKKWAIFGNFWKIFLVKKFGVVPMERILWKFSEVFLIVLYNYPGRVIGRTLQLFPLLGKNGQFLWFLENFLSQKSKKFFSCQTLLNGLKRGEN